MYIVKARVPSIDSGMLCALQPSTVQRGAHKKVNTALKLMCLLILFRARHSNIKMQKLSLSMFDTLTITRSVTRFLNIVSTVGPDN